MRAISIHLAALPVWCLGVLAGQGKGWAFVGGCAYIAVFTVVVFLLSSSKAPVRIPK